MHELIIRGCRGTVPVCRSDFIKYGGASTCFSVNTPKGPLIIDAGTGIRGLSPSSETEEIFLLFTHFHLDHIAGLPVFSPLYDRNRRVTIMGDPLRKDKWRHTLQNFMAKPYWPVGIGETAATLIMNDLEPGAELVIDDVCIKWMELPHPQGCLGFRISTPSYSAVIATDVEFPGGRITDRFLAFCNDADYLIFDAHYTPDEINKYKGWGHSSWATACEAAKSASVKNLILTHHAPERTDNEIAEIEKMTRDVFPSAKAGACGMTIWPQI